jgi:ABC-type polysaccharide/polyol phosphate export permease
MTTLTMTHADARARWTISGIWRFRELLRTLTVRNLKVKYKRSVLGFVWTLLNPLMTLATIVGVFTYVVHIAVPSYWAFLVSGFFVWNFVLLVLNAATQSLSEHAALARSVPIPAEVFVLATVASRLVEFLLELALFIPALILFHHHGVPISYTLLPLLVVFQTLMALGLVLPIATLAAFYDDVQHALPVVLLMLFYISPVFYPVRLVPEAMRPIYELNPIARLLTAFHTTLYEGKMPTLGSLVTLGLVSMGLCLLGFAVFNRYKSVFVEIL